MGKYSRDCLNAVKKLCENLEIELHIYDIKKEMGSSMCYLRSSIQSKKSLKNCAICGVIKKWILNREARKLKADKIATGHHLDDEIQTFMLNVLKGNPELSANSGAITKNIPDKKFIPRIKPLFYIPEEEIREYAKAKKLPVVYEKCPCAIDSYRIQIREFMKNLSRKEKENIMKNAEKILERVEHRSVYTLKGTSPKLRNTGAKKSKITYCEKCGEPSRNQICKMCELTKDF